ncbi:DUF3667 domain-containing protein [Telluria beijingensis]|uniref:DUF3667 domain-containing protein n=1 Tax=Telluria beijingensis TaxID=3068633 RepID=UPI002795EE2B|nr:DUF3667 domain-containing protein [Massilia sp. REN29]
MSTDTLSHHTDIACKNCGATTQGNYCQQCGQATHLHVPSAREFLHEFIAHYVALEGKLWKTLALLIARPGVLTREYIEGRRVRYLEPLRVYLTFSIIFFAIFKLSGTEMLIQLGDPTPELAAAVADGRAKDTLFGPALPEHADQFERTVGKVKERTSTMHPVLQEKVARFSAMSPQEQRAAFKLVFFSYTPYAIFAMMPLFAFYLKLLYLGSGRRYGEHFLFALHTNAFAFMLLSAMILVPASWSFVVFMLLVWLTFYLPVAMRRVYGGGWTVTIVRWLLLIFAHTISIASAVLTVFSQVLMT